jgi:hypothetical protein
MMTGATSSLILPSSGRIESRQMGSYATRLEIRLPEGAPRNVAMSAALGGARLLNTPMEDVYQQWATLLSLSDDDYRRVAGTAGRLETRLDFHLARWTRRATLPLAPGAVQAAARSRVDIVDVLQRPGAVTVFVRYWESRSPLSPGVQRSTRFALVNRSRGEAVAGDSEPRGVGASLNIGGLGLFEVSTAGAAGFALREETVYFPGRQTRTGVPQPLIDAAWIAGAELAMVESRYAGKVTRTFTADDFRIPTPRDAAALEP